MTIYEGFQNVQWTDLKNGQTVYIDEYEGGLYPHADPKISGPFTVKDVERRLLMTAFKLNGNELQFMHYPSNLLVKKEDKA